MRQCVVMVLAGVLLAPQALQAEAKKAPLDKASREKAEKLVDGGVKFLLSKRQPNGGWSIDGAFEPAVTALVLKGLVQHPDYDVNSPVVKKGFERLLSYQQPSGAICDPRQGVSNYCTSIAVTALAAAGDPKFKPAIDKAIKYLRSIQIRPGSKSPEGATITKGHPFVGGVSYGKKHGRPDLNNLGWWMEAMHAAAVPYDDPDVQRALAFVSRCQNRKASNKLAWAKKGSDDGGFIYAPAKRDIKLGESKAGTGPDGHGLRSYGSMTYTGFMSMLYAGLTKKDPRVQAAYDWFRQNWTLDCNPNMPEKQRQQGMYFYYLVFARALRAWGQAEIPAWQGKEKHNWRKELIDELAKRVRPDGSWLNSAESRWCEGNSVLTTSYEVQALQETLK